MPTGGCTVDSRNVTVNLPDFPGSAEIPLGVYCSSEQKLSFYLSGATTDSARQVFANTAPDATKASGVGVSLMRNGKTLATGENVSLGTVNKSNRALICMGGNFALAMPDREASAVPLTQLDLAVHVATKLNRSHFITSKGLLEDPSSAFNSKLVMATVRSHDQYNARNYLVEQKVMSTRYGLLFPFF